LVFLGRDLQETIEFFLLLKEKYDRIKALESILTSMVFPLTQNMVEEKHNLIDEVMFLRNENTILILKGQIMEEMIVVLEAK
jgi:hypothetical protein